MNESELKDQLIQALKDYINLLGQELNDLAGMAFVRGWRSSEDKIKQGEDLRTSIEQLEKQISDEKA